MNQSQDDDVPTALDALVVTNTNQLQHDDVPMQSDDDVPVALDAPAVNPMSLGFFCDDKGQSARGNSRIVEASRAATVGQAIKSLADAASRYKEVHGYIVAVLARLSEVILQRDWSKADPVKPTSFSAKVFFTLPKDLWKIVHEHLKRDHDICITPTCQSLPFRLDRWTILRVEYVE